MRFPPQLEVKFFIMWLKLVITEPENTVHGDATYEGVTPEEHSGIVQFEILSSLI